MGEALMSSPTPKDINDSRSLQDSWGRRHDAEPALAAFTRLVEEFSKVESSIDKERLIPALNAWQARRRLDEDRISLTLKRINQHNETTAEALRQIQVSTNDALKRIEAAAGQIVSTAWRHSMLQSLVLNDSATKRAQRAIDGLLADGLIDVSSAERARQFVDVFFTPNTIYTSIAPDDGGITFYWRAQDMSVEIDIYPTEGYWWRVRNVALENYTDHGKELPIEKLKHSLKMFSKEVDRLNPNWRSQPI